MPVIRIVGFEGSDDICRDLIRELQIGVASIDELGVTQKQVSPFIERGVVQAVPGEEVVAYVDGLFEKPERTPEVCKRLTDIIYWTIVIVVQKFQLTRIKFVEVINYKIDPETAGYSSGNPFDWTEDQVIKAFNAFRDLTNADTTKNEEELRTFLKTMGNSFGRKEVALAVRHCVPSHCEGHMVNAVIGQLERMN